MLATILKGERAEKTEVKDYEFSSWGTCPLSLPAGLSHKHRCKATSGFAL